MNLQDRSTLFRKTCRIGGGVLLLVGLSAPLVGGGPTPVEKDAPKKPAAADGKPVPAEALFHDDSKLKLALRDERIELVTPYGKLLIPTADIRQIDFGFHVDADSVKRVEAGIARLGSADFKERLTATTELFALGPKAYPALVEAAKSNDMEVARRADEVLSKLRDTILPEILERPANDVVQTGNSRITGRIAADSFKVKTSQFGDQQVLLSDLRTLRLAGAEADVVALPDPGSLMNYQDKIGKSFVFKVTGNATGSIWGTGVYTPDSALATAAVHAGVLRAGQTGPVKITIVVGPAGYAGSQQNGITSGPWNGGFTGAYQVGKP